MNDSLQVILADVDRCKKALRRVKNDQVHSQQLRDDLRRIADSYFSDLRPTLLKSGVQAADLNEIDSHLRELAQSCHKRGTVAKYLRLLDSARAAAITIDGVLLTSHGADADSGITPADGDIIRTLSAMVPGASASYSQAVQDLQSSTRHSWRGPATDLREALRETLDYLAADADVIAMPGFKLEPNCSGPTMKQKVRYVLKNREVSKAISEPTEDAATLIDSIVGSFVRSVYTRSNISTHTPTDKKEVARLLQYVRLVLCELLEIDAK